MKPKVININVVIEDETDLDEIEYPEDSENEFIEFEDEEPREKESFIQKISKWFR